MPGGDFLSRSTPASNPGFRGLTPRYWRQSMPTAVIAAVSPLPERYWYVPLDGPSTESRNRSTFRSVPAGTLRPDIWPLLSAIRAQPVTEVSPAVRGL